MKQQLRNTTKNHAPSYRNDWLADVGCPEDCRSNDSEIEKDGGKGWHLKVAVGIEDPARECNQGYQQKIGEGNAREQDGQLKFGRVGGETGGEEINEDARPKNPDEGDDQEAEQ